MDDTNRCARCNRPAHETCDDGFCSACWTADEVSDVLIGHAMDVALGHTPADDGPSEVAAHLGRDMTGEEQEEWAATLAEARRQASMMRRTSLARSCGVA